MSSNDYIMIAGRIRAALEQKKSFTGSDAQWNENSR